MKTAPQLVFTSIAYLIDQPQLKRSFGQQRSNPLFYLE